MTINKVKADRIRLAQLRDMEDNDEELTRSEVREFRAILERNPYLTRVSKYHDLVVRKLLRNELFEAPFNLAGEVATNEASAEGEARAAVEARHAMNKLQMDLI